MSYLGVWPHGLLTQTFVKQKAGVYALNLPSSSFLNQPGAVNAYLLKDKHSNFVFCIIPSVKDQIFAQFFPEMLPFDPWGITDLNSLPFPNLAATQIEQIKWLYVFCNTTSALPCKKLLDQAKFLTNLKSSPFYAKPAGEILDQLTNLSKDATPYVTADDWQGGLYYFGKAPLGKALTAQTHWDIPIESIAVKGCLYYHEFMPMLSLQATLLDLDNPFGDADVPIKSLRLIANIDTALWHDVAESLQHIGASQRYIGLEGSIQFSNSNNNIALYGQWPLVGDDIILHLSCRFKDLQLDLQHFPVALPDELDAEVRFVISKAQRNVQHLAVAVRLAQWVIIADLLVLKAVELRVGVYDPGGSKQIVADFSGHAVFGKGKGIGLICHGNYPLGDYSLGLDPNTPIHLDGLLESILGSSAGLSADLVIAQLSGEFNSQTKYLNVSASVSNQHTWHSEQTHGFELAEIGLNIQGIQGTGVNSYQLTAHFTVAHQDASQAIQLRAMALYSNNEWLFSASYEGHVSLQDVAALFGFSGAPDELTTFTFTALNLSFSTGSKDKLLSGSGEFKFDGKRVQLHLEIALLGTGEDLQTHFSGNFRYIRNLQDRSQDLDFIVQFDKNKQGYDAVFSIQFMVAKVPISLQAEKQQVTKTTKRVSDATFSGHVCGLDIPLTDILKKMVAEVLPSMPMDLLPDFTITEVFVIYKGANKEWILFAITEIDGKEFRFFFHKTAKSKDQEASKTFTIQTDLADLGGLPLVGPQLKEVKIENVGLSYLSHDGQPKIPKVSVDEQGVSKLLIEQSTATLRKGINLSGDISLPMLPAPITLDLPVSKHKTAQKQDEKATPVTEKFSDMGAEPAKAKKVGMSVGPVNIKKVGLVLKKGHIGIKVTGGLSFAAFEFDLINLQVTFPHSVLKDPAKLTDIAFGLEGFTADIHKGELTIAGGFLREHHKEDGGYDEFSGIVEVRLPPFTLSGMGSYAKYEGLPSLFLFAAIGYPIAVHPALLIQGMALGFGIHRDFVTPALGSIIDYPLIQAAMTPPPPMDIAKMVESMHAFFPPMVGEYFVVAGINFKAFGLIDNNAMLAVKFGQQLEIDLLGVSSIALEATFLELEWLVRFLPDEGYLYMGGQITNRSYILMPNVHPTGSFAVAAWTGQQHHGEYVVTIGGYCSNFAAPAHYPQHLERMTMAFNIGMLSVKGGAYFAITPKMIMMGGFLNASIHLGPITGYLKATMDMVIWYQPFHYDIKIGIDAGIKLDIPMLFFTLHINLHLHADMHIWGPDFAGEALLDIGIKTIRIGFGDSKNTVIPASWQQFQEKFLPLGQVCSLSVTAGVIRKISYKIGGIVKEIHIVNPKQLIVEANSTMPFTQAKGIETPTDSHTPGIVPMALVSYEASLTVKIKKDKNLDNDHFSMTLITNSVAAAIWGNQGLSKSSKPDAKDSVIQNALTGIKVRPSHEIISGVTHAMDKRCLAYNNDDYVVTAETGYAFDKDAKTKQPISVKRVKNTYSNWTGLDVSTGAFSSEEALQPPTTQTLKRAAYV